MAYRTAEWIGAEIEKDTIGSFLDSVRILALELSLSAHSYYIAIERVDEGKG